jgi:ABC-type bacteriocin/lantibiotic exporter with double-glycine peptidase domain
MPRLVAVKSSRQLLVYSAIRLLLFAIVLTVMMLLHVNVFVSAIAAAIIAFCISYIFFRGKRDALAQEIAERRAQKVRDDDNDIENQALDRSEE